MEPKQTEDANPKGDKMCRYKDACTRNNCKYQHPTKQTVTDQPETNKPSEEKEKKPRKEKKPKEDQDETKDEKEKKPRKERKPKDDQDETKDEKEKKPRKEKKPKDDQEETKDEKEKNPRKEKKPKEKQEPEDSESDSDDGEKCPMLAKCEDFDCLLKHPKGRKKACKFELSCLRADCFFLHPKDRKPICPDGKKCMDFACDLLHPQGRPRPCKNKENCNKANCYFLHPSSRKGMCKDDEECEVYACTFMHSPQRKKLCFRGVNCRNPTCAKIHPPKPDPCADGANCMSFACKLYHPPGRIKVCSITCKDPLCEGLHPAEWNPLSNIEEDSKKKNLRTIEERNLYRKGTNLDILNYKEIMIKKLQVEGAIVVTGFSGAGKSTQIPQFMAESFPGLILYTNPNQISVIVNAERIANEFDNASVGENVGYEMEGGKAIKGKRIQLITDTTFMKDQIKKDPLLKNVSVLIIDEIDKRMMNTDLTVGVAKLLRQQRPNDFYVVMISSKNESRQILELFHGQNCPNQSIDIPQKNMLNVQEEENPIENQNSLDTLVPLIVETRKKYRDGNFLVFLSGVFEIYEAIKEMKKVTKDKYECCAFSPSLSPEELNAILSSTAEDRKIIFCSDFAESSYRIPNISVVIDTGLIKQSKYDAKRSLNVSEQIYITREQQLIRKELAGNGVYLRLYSLERLEKNKEPQILRNSLDSLVLELKILKYDPVSFPFLTKPKEESLKSSFELLRNFGCIDDTAKKEILPKGELLAVLPFNLKLNSFVIQGLELYNDAENFTILASILSIQDSLFAIRGGEVKKGAAKANIMEIALKHNSDLQLLWETFRNWYESGSCKDEKCSKCQRTIPKKTNGCRFCRFKYAQENKLNKRNMEKVLAMKEQAMNVLEKCSVSSKVQTNDISFTEKIGRCLASCFPENIGEILFPENPSLGVNLFDGGAKGSFSTTSTFLQRSQNCSIVIAMSITKLESEYYILDQVHPILMEWIPERIMKNFGKMKKELQECFVFPNCHGRYCTQLFKELKIIEKSYPWAPYTIVNYENSSCSLKIYGPKADSQKIADFCRNTLLKYKTEALEFDINASISNGTAVVSLSSGMKVKKVQPGTSTQIRFSVEIDIKTKEEFIIWLCKAAELKATDIKWCNFLKRNADDEKANAYVGFADENCAQRAKKLKQASFQYSQEELSKTIVLNIPHAIYNQKQLEDALQQLETPPSKAWEPSQPFFQILIKKIDNKFKNVTEIKTVLSSYKLEDIVDMDIHGKKFGFLRFKNQESRNKALQTLIEQRWTVDANDNELNHRFFIRFQRPEDAQTFSKTVFSTMFPTKVSCEGFETVRVERAHLFPRLNEYITLISTNLQCQFEIKKEKIDKQKKEAKNKKKNDFNFTKIIFKGASPIVVGQAAKQLLKIVAPMSIKFGTNQQRTLTKEINDVGLLNKWDQEFGLEHKVYEDDKTRDVFKMEIYGDQMKQGSYMAKILEYSDNFNKRYMCIPVPQTMRFLFRKNMNGGMFLENLNKELKKSGTVKFVKFESLVEIYFRPNKADLLEDTIKKIKKFMEDRSSEKEMLENLDETVNPCIYCEKAGGQPFSICGHHFCSGCLSNEAKNNGSSQQLECKSCRTVISIRDIKNCLSDEEFTTLAENVVKSYLSQYNDQTMCICPGVGCSALKEKKLGYSVCVWCETGFCPNCGEQNNTLHEKKTCKEFKELKQIYAKCPIAICGTLRDKRLGYSFCQGCKNFSCPICGEHNKIHHMGRTCSEYKEYLKKLIICPIASCGFIRVRASGYSLCDGCNTLSCPFCGEVNKPHHKNRSCQEYQQLLINYTYCQCGELKEKKRGYSKCSACWKSSCPICGVTEQNLHENKTCDEYQKVLKSSVPCPKCKTPKQKNFGYSKCAMCTMSFCPFCNERDNFYHEGKTCKQFQDHLKLLVRCPNISCSSLRYKALGYSLCNLCQVESCPNCGEVSNPYHRLKSCEEFQLLKSKLIPCPIQGCKALRNISYSNCYLCNAASCPLCSAQNAPLHEGKTCEKYKEEVEKSFGGINLLSIISRAYSFVNEKWDSIQLQKPFRIETNPGLEKGCPAMKKFCAAVQIMGDTALKNGFFAWHGTGSDEGVAGICNSGFDPSKRSGQAYGPGEYFGQTPLASHSYARQSCRMIVAFLLKAPIVSTHGNFCYVVNNPVDFKTAYNLPVLVITYLQNKPLMPFLQSVVQDKPQTQWKPVFRWQWEMDDHSFQPYNDQINIMIESAYEQFQQHRTGSSFTTPPIIRFIDDLPQQYKIDFLNNLQTNLKTSFTRRIKRDKVNLPGTNMTWQFLNENNQWEKFESMVQGQIEQAFIQYYQNRGSSSLGNLHFPGRPEAYTIDFVNGLQINESSGNTRNIRRT